MSVRLHKLVELISRAITQEERSHVFWAIYSGVSGLAIQPACFACERVFKLSSETIFYVRDNPHLAPHSHQNGADALLKLFSQLSFPPFFHIYLYHGGNHGDYILCSSVFLISALQNLVLYGLLESNHRAPKISEQETKPTWIGYWVDHCFHILWVLHVGFFLDGSAGGSMLDSMCGSSVPVAQIEGSGHLLWNKGDVRGFDDKKEKLPKSY